MAGIGGALLLVGVSSVFWWRSSASTTKGKPQLIFSPSELKEQLVSLGIRQPKPIAELFVGDASIARFAKEMAQGSSKRDQALSLQKALGETLKRHGIQCVLPFRPRPTPPMSAQELFAAIQTKDQSLAPYPLELALFLVTALRELGIPAAVAEIHQLPELKRPPDPTGQFGYFGSVLLEPNSEQALLLLDPFGGRSFEPSSVELRVLSDLQAVGAWLNLRAMHLLLHDNLPEKALEANAQALKLDPRSANSRAVRASILVALGNFPEAQSELEAAVQLCPSGPHRHLLAQLHLARGALDEARRLLAQVLEQFPSDGSARATLAALHLAQGDVEAAEAELSEAERTDPQPPTVPTLRAMLFAERGETQKALVEIERALKNSIDPNTHLVAAQIYRQAGQFDKMRKEVKTFLAKAPSHQKEALRSLILQRLGPTAIGDELEEEKPEDPNASKERLQLELNPQIAPTLPSEPENSGPSLLEPKQEPTILLGNRKRFGLGVGSLSIGESK
ncbi:MAG: tetratricopeptide repeat protein [Sandaracinaceae bacterium]|nr:tetratricopeptide repeat protein [Sandaracinaceae bacterium]